MNVPMDDQTFLEEVFLFNLETVDEHSDTVQYETRDRSAECLQRACSIFLVLTLHHDRQGEPLVIFLRHDYLLQRPQGGSVVAGQEHDKVE